MTIRDTIQDQPEEPKREIQVEVEEMDGAIRDLENVVAQLKVRLKSVIAEYPQKAGSECDVGGAAIQTQLGGTLHHMRHRIYTMCQSLDNIVRDVQL